MSLNLSTIKRIKLAEKLHSFVLTLYDNKDNILNVHDILDSVTMTVLAGCEI